MALLFTLATESPHTYLRCTVPDLEEDEKLESPDHEEEERPADAGDPGDWGNAGRWGTFGNRPSFHREEVWREDT